MDALLSLGERGRAAFEALARGGMRSFGPSKAAGSQPIQAGALPRRAAERGDEAAQDLLLAQLRREAAGSARQAAELSHLGRRALNSPELGALVERLVREDPEAWAAAREPGCESLPKIALTAGNLRLARAFILADPKSALAEMNPRQVDQFKDPAAAIALLAELGADFHSPGSDGVHALSWAAVRWNGSPEAVAKLMELGCDPRAASPTGATAIGEAAMHWSWAELQARLGAAPSDLMDSWHRRHWDDEALPAPLQAVKQAAEGLSPALEDKDALLAEILWAAGADPRAKAPGFIERGAELCCENGLPRCLGAILDIARTARALPSARALEGALASIASQPERNLSRRRCLELALDAGVDAASPYADERGDPDSLIGVAARSLVRSAAADLRDVQEMAGLMALLASHGCDPRGVRGDDEDDGDDGRWSFDPEGPGGRASLAPKAIQAFEAIDALLEARELRTSLPARDAPAPRLRI